MQVGYLRGLWCRLRHRQGDGFPCGGAQPGGDLAGGDAQQRDAAFAQVERERHVILIARYQNDPRCCAAQHQIERIDGQRDVGGVLAAARIDAAQPRHRAPARHAGRIGMNPHHRQISGRAGDLQDLREVVGRDVITVDQQGEGAGGLSDIMGDS